MIIATFGPTTGWSGKTITFESEIFALEGYGPISAADVVEYDRQGHLSWATHGTRAWVEALAEASRVSQVALPASAGASPATSGIPAAQAIASPSARPAPEVAVAAKPRSTGLEGVSRGDWVVVAGSLAMFFGMLLAWTADVYNFAGGWFPMLAAIAAVVVVVLSSGVIPERRYEMSGRSPLIIMALGAVALLVVLIGMIVETARGWEAGSSVALLGAVAVVGGGFLKMREPVAAAPVAAPVFAGNAMPAASVAVTPSPVAVQAPGDAPGSRSAQTTDVEPRAPGPATAAQADPRLADTLVERPAAAEPPVSVEPLASGPATAEAASDLPATSVADEIVKLADLRAKGILTDDEFAAFKAKLVE